MDNWFVQGLVVVLAGTGLLAISGWVWKFLKGPIDHFDEQLRNRAPQPGGTPADTNKLSARGKTAK